MLKSAQIPFDIIGITESKQLVNTNFLTNVNIDGSKLHTQRTKSSHGGVALYVKVSLDHEIRWDLSVLEDNFESLSVEIKTGHKSKNILCCCIYRHPITDVGKFTEHLESVLSKYDKSSKIISIMGDFNILHPTKATDHSATFTDNIFSNVTDFETVSGNIFNQIADHYSQLLIITKLQVDYKSSTFYQYNYSNFRQDKFIQDFSKLNWDKLNYASIHVNTKFEIFHDGLSSCVSRHAPLIKVSRKTLSFKPSHGYP